MLMADQDNARPVQTEDDPTHARRAVATVLAGLSAAWQNRRYDELAANFDEQIVMALPGFSGRVEGRDVLVESYREFMERATLTHYAEEPPTIDVWGSTAAASYRWEMRWLANNVSNHAAGSEMFIFARRSADGGEWRAVWRTVAFDPVAA